MPELPTHPAASRLLGETLVQAIDAYFQARARLIRALIAHSEADAHAANRESREALSTWLALLVERLDSRNAALLVDMLKRVEALEAEQGRLVLRVTNLESLMGVTSPVPLDDVDDPTGFDAGRRS